MEELPNNDRPSITSAERLRQLIEAAVETHRAELRISPSPPTLAVSIGEVGALNTIANALPRRAESPPPPIAPPGLERLTIGGVCVDGVAYTVTFAIYSATPE